MFTFEFECILTGDVQPEIYDEIVALQQRTFRIPADVIINTIKKREEVILYRDKKSQKLIGVFTLQWIQYKKNTVIYYMGNTVVDADYRQFGILSHAHLYAIQIAFLKFPEKQCFASGLVLTEESYLAHIKKFSEEIFPRPNVQTPDHILDIMKHVADTIVGKDHYRINHGALITTALATRVNERNIRSLEPVPTSMSGIDYFKVVNKNYSKGEQLLLIAPINHQNLTCLLGMTQKKIRVFIRSHPKSVMSTIMKGWS